MGQEESARTLDSVALAHYLTGDPVRAAAIQRQALEALGDGESELRKMLEAKLAKYLKAAKDAGLDVE